MYKQNAEPYYYLWIPKPTILTLVVMLKYGPAIHDDSLSHNPS